MHQLAGAKLAPKPQVAPSRPVSRPTANRESSRSPSTHPPRQIHFVHWNCTHFDSAQEASRHKHGLAVLAVLVQALDGDQNKNKHLDKILTGLSRISKPNSSHQLSEARLDLKKLFPSNRCHYATYEGSLTTPPLSEVVDWIVFLQPIQCSVGQVDQFRQLQCNSGPLLKNCRPIQPLNERTVSVWSQTTAPLRNVL